MDGRKFVSTVVSIAVALVVAAGVAPAAAQGPFIDTLQLVGAQEVPLILTGGQGRFTFRLQRAKIIWELEYSGIEGGAVTQAHVHVGQSGANGGIALFLCSNLGNGPAGTQACPPSPATIGGISEADDIVAIGGQGLPVMDFAKFAAAMRGGMTYANVHTTAFPGGEVRGQIGHDH
jgi:hypothetical protein